MFVSNKVVFVELHKTGGTHIGKWLQTLVGGEQVGKHNRIPPLLWDRFVIGSIRNPWDWYVSLWAYGCAGSGSVRKQSCRLVDLRYCWDELPHEMGRKWLSPNQWARQTISDVSKPIARWRNAYRDSESPEAFREWLCLLLDSRRRFDIGEGYGFSPISTQAGLLTYRYFKLFTKLGDELYSDTSLSSSERLSDVWNERRLVSFLVRNENLEEDLLMALDTAGVALSDDQKVTLLNARNNKLNASNRRATNFYYDQETIELVASRERFIAVQHGYFPAIGE